MGQMTTFRYTLITSAKDQNTATNH